MDGADEVHGLAVVQQYMEATERWRPDSNELLHWEAFQAALHLGYEDYFAGRQVMPMTFLFNEFLQQLWLEGHQLARSAVEMRLCRAHGGWKCTCAQRIDGVCWRDGRRQCIVSERQSRAASLAALGEGSA